MKWLRRITSNINAWVSVCLWEKVESMIPYQFITFKCGMRFFQNATRSNFCANRKIWICNLLPDSCCCVRCARCVKFKWQGADEWRKRRWYKRASFDKCWNCLRCAKWNTKKSVFFCFYPRVSHRMSFLLSFHFFSLSHSSKMRLFVHINNNQQQQ